MQEACKYSQIHANSQTSCAKNFFLKMPFHFFGKMSLPQTVYFSITNFWYKLTQPNLHLSQDRDTLSSLHSGLQGLLGLTLAGIKPLSVYPPTFHILPTELWHLLCQLSQEKMFSHPQLQLQKSNRPNRQASGLVKNILTWR